jgi:uncharacterized surface protein with fasciclin (FAS1) repeats
MNRFLITAAIATLSMGVSANLAAAQTPAAPATAAPAAPVGSIPQMNLPAHGDIADTLRASGQFTILVKALDATALTSVLKRPGPLTLLAPTDAAFQAMPADQLASLMKPENAAQLQALLAYHLINSAVPPSKIQGSKGPIRTASGASVQVDGSGATLKVNDANVIGVTAVSNGTIYVVDKVLSAQTVAPVAAAGSTAGQ